MNSGNAVVFKHDSSNVRMDQKRTTTRGPICVVRRCEIYWRKISMSITVWARAKLTNGWKDSVHGGARCEQLSVVTHVKVGKQIYTWDVLLSCYCWYYTVWYSVSHYTCRNCQLPRFYSIFLSTVSILLFTEQVFFRTLILLSWFVRRLQNLTFCSCLSPKFVETRMGKRPVGMGSKAVSYAWHVCYPGICNYVVNRGNKYELHWSWTTFSIART